MRIFPRERLLFASWVATVACSPGTADDELPTGPIRAPSERRPNTAQPDASAPADSKRSEISTPNEIAGSRLKPVYRKVTGNDGSTLLTLQSWYDTQRGEACTFQRLADGEVHCAPAGEAPVLGESFFVDASCSMPVMVFHRSPPSPTQPCTPSTSVSKRYAKIDSGSPCAPARLIELSKAGRLAAVTTVHRKTSEDTCEVYPLEDDDYEVFVVPSPAEEFDPDSFVKMTVVDETPPTGKRLRNSRKIYTGADGSKAISAQRIVDTERNEFCVHTADQYGVFRCMPHAEDVYASGSYSDSSCTQRSWSLTNHANCEDDARHTASRYMARVVYDACFRTEIFPRFMSAPLSTVYYGTPSSCSGVSLSTAPAAGAFYYASQPLPPAISPNQFALLQRFERDAPQNSYGASGARLLLREIGHVSPDGFESFSGISYHDRELGSACHPMVLDDGKSYCVGSVEHLAFEPADGIFVDSACSVAVVGVPKTDLACAAAYGSVAAKFVAGHTRLSNGCNVNRLYRPGTQIAVETLYARNQNMTCSASHLRASDYDLYRASELSEVVPSTFVEVTSSVVK
ncbi:MAG TPA: hypothetical protein VM580_04730 [Labilithrix sp.]|nr:hypothetical protein [Labilithrix sp.]